MLAERLCCVGQWESPGFACTGAGWNVRHIALNAFEYWICLVFCPFWELRANA
ncbi:hypothetical protein HMPREF1577_01074 [Gardnerella pickettii JCP8017A]|uniref:Uncharacterized protein n=1 Tax=Gardnerella pickettii JCP8017A TaxID=1261062 RepID=T2PJU3_9BIFI|nr:hypothetical protein HMPREF1577_01074 [Gardnerella pickettii JCP8017A]EPI60651.1 hypothetical protein HMPREF1578_01114 [Gardnerella pickettii JCP8017B]